MRRVSGLLSFRTAAYLLHAYLVLHCSNDTGERWGGGQLHLLNQIAWIMRHESQLLNGHAWYTVTLSAAWKHCMSPPTNIEEEIAAYLEQLPIPRTPCVRTWWHENESRFPGLARVARRYLGAPCTSVASDRCFNVFTEQRSRLAADRAEMIIVVKQLSIICVQLTMTIKLTKFIHNAQHKYR